MDSIRFKSYIWPILGPLRPTNRPEISASNIFLPFFGMVISEIFANLEKIWIYCLWIIKTSLFFVLIIRKFNMDLITVKSYIWPNLGPFRLTNRWKFLQAKHFCFLGRKISEVTIQKKVKQFCLHKFLADWSAEGIPKFAECTFCPVLSPTFNFLTIKTKTKLVLIIKT